MSYYRVILNGENFLLEVDGSIRRVGFFTTRFVQAPDRSAAAYAAMGALKAEGSLSPLNRPEDPTRVVVDEIEEVGEDEIPPVAAGFAFFDDDGSGEE